MENGKISEEKLMMPYIDKKLIDKSKRVNEYLRYYYAENDFPEDYEDYIRPLDQT